MLNSLFTIVISVTLTTTRCTTLCAATCHTLAVILLLSAYRRRHQLGLTINHTPANPHLDTYAAIGGMRFCISIINVGTQRMQWRTTLFEMLATGYLGTANTTSDGNLNTFGTRTHRARDGILDSTSICLAIFWATNTASISGRFTSLMLI